MSDVPEWVSFRVEGDPIPQGSKTVAKAGSRVWLRDANGAKLKPWRDRVAAAADLGFTFDVPVSVTATFGLRMPKRPKFRVPAVKPDLDKLCRSLLDGMTDGGLLADDSRVVRLMVHKVYSETPGVDVKVRAWDAS